MKLVRISRSAVSGLLVAVSLGLAAFSTIATAQELKFKLSGAAEVPPVATTASGNGAITVGKDMAVSGTLMTSGIKASMAHIHHGKVGTNGPVIITLTSSSDDVWRVPDGSKLNEAEYRAYLAGELYVNVHSEKYKGGELRGQLLPGKPSNGK